jgi:hypothetical protein
MIQSKYLVVKMADSGSEFPDISGHVGLKGKI